MEERMRVSRVNEKLDDSDLTEVIEDSQKVETFILCTHNNNIGNNKITYRGIGLLASRQWNKLTYLDLSIASMMQYTQSQLDNNNIGSKGCRALTRMNMP